MKNKILKCKVCNGTGLTIKKEEGFIETLLNTFLYNANNQEICPQCDGTGVRVIKIEDN